MNSDNQSITAANYIQRSSEIYANNKHGVRVNQDKVILLWTPFYKQELWWFKEGNKTFVEGGCQESRCIITNDRKYENISSAIMFHLRNLGPKLQLPQRNNNQYWICTIFESPENTNFTGLPKYRYAFNKTLSYRTGSDFYHPGISVIPKEPMGTEFVVPSLALNRTKLILWYVSNCRSKARLSYARKLAKHVPVDIFGHCGRKDPCKGNSSCVKAAKLKYKFYLAFENSRCPDYITEKFWLNLLDGIVPIVRGPRIVDYEKVAPPNSFIHVDNFTSPKKLADYIKYLDRNDEAYYGYHKWRHTHLVKTVPLKSSPCWCQLCSMLHNKTDSSKNHSYYDLEQFWGPEQCF